LSHVPNPLTDPDFPEWFDSEDEDEDG